MRDGERRVMRKKHRYSPDLPFDVVAYREDCDTPYVVLKNETSEHYLTDSQAGELIERLKRAIGMLPSSK